MRASPLRDELDLLLRLRNLLRDEPGVRAEYQALFDHLFRGRVPGHPTP